MVPFKSLAGFYFFYFAYLGSFAPFFPLYLDSVGLAPFHIAVLMALPQATRIVAPQLWGWLADRSGARVLVVRVTGLIGTAVFLAVFAGTGFALLFATIAVMTFFWSAALPLMEATTLTHLGEETARYGRIRVWGSVGFIAAVIGLGHLLDQVAMGAVPLTVLAMMLECAWMIPEAPVPQHADEPRFARVILKPEVLALIAGGAFMAAAHGPYYTFFSIHLAGHGYSAGAIGWLWALGVASEIAIFVWMPRLYRAFTLRSILLASFALAVVRFVAIGWLAQSFAALLLAQVLHAATFGAYHAAAIGYVHQLFRGRLQARGQAIYGSMGFGVGGALGALASGALWAPAGAGPTFTFAAVCAALGGVVFAWGTRAPPASRIQYN